MLEFRAQSLGDVRAHLADVVDLAVQDVPTVVSRRGKPVAAVISMEMFHQFERWEEAALDRLIDERMSDESPGIPLADVIAETLARDE